MSRVLKYHPIYKLTTSISIILACLCFQYLTSSGCMAAQHNSADFDNETSRDNSQNNTSTYSEGPGNNQLEPILEKALEAYGDKLNLSRFADSAQFTGVIYKEEDHWRKQAYKYVRKMPAWRTDVEEGTSTIFDGTDYWQITQAPVGEGLSGREAYELRRTGAAESKNINAPPAGFAGLATPASPPAGEENPKEEDGMPPLAPVIKKPAGPVIKRLSPEQSQWLSDQAQRQPFLLAYWQTPAYHFKLLGETSYKQIPVYAIEITEKNNTPTLIYLDRSNYLVVAITFQSWQSGETDQPKKVTVTKEYSENRPALESIWPFKETLLVDGKAAAVFSLASIGPANDISPDYFKPPSQESQGYAAHQLRLPRSVTVPFEYCQSEIVCRGKIENYDPLWFLIDTGTSDTIIDRSIAAQCLLTRGNDFRFSSFRGSIPAQTTRLDRLELGKLIINNIDAQITDLSPQSKQIGRPIAGIIGMNVLSNYLITIDYAKPSLLFADSYTGSRPAEFVSVGFVQAADHTDASNSPPVPKIKITLPGADSQTMLMDTGAAFNHLSANIATRHLKDNLSNTSHTLEGTGLDGRPVQLALLTLDPVIIGSYKVHRVTFTYPKDDADKTGSKIQPAVPTKDLLHNELNVAGILGNPFF